METNNWENYFIEKTNVLKNKLNINNNEELKSKEKEIVLKKLVDLYFNPIKGNFDSEHLKKIHKYLFDEIYYFAGEFRNVNISKSVKSPFTDFNLISRELNSILGNIDNFILNKATSDFFYAEALAKIYHRLIHIHPFREGNGRTIREFMRE